ncbi:MAG: 5-formyltetrahydrofolate cyclo-ligase [Oscillospiraceae bacterium]|jgi:5-formyltetrahydrofolate cyclo-ligase|nr:5-formyltetrahydrofolate cyclo-ligase [Oscillospiraceae bacterium]
MQKKELRKALLARRRAMPPEKKRAQDAALCGRIAAHPWFLQADCVQGFVPIGGEPDILPVLRLALQMGKTLGLPRCKPAESAMTFYFVDSFDALRPGAHNIPEPPRDALLCTPGPQTLCLVPGLAFDPTGVRLGYGKGYYDRFLPGFPGRTMGVCHADFLLQALPKDANDMPVQMVLT